MPSLPGCGVGLLHRDKVLPAVPGVHPLKAAGKQLRGRFLPVLVAGLQLSVHFVCGHTVAPVMLPLLPHTGGAAAGQVAPLVVLVAGGDGAPTVHGGACHLPVAVVGGSPHPAPAS